ncbi:hypothetical protein LENED_004831 [Lentinula edodes]|uniref:Uncharacterized protein n=1 Tax=Lentinula edodes TaxID=5353 RepID=A0A1Q3E7A5_LENED|nr:hypothetical protein LENED_004831 [Lentinula edodes]
MWVLKCPHKDNFSSEQLSKSKNVLVIPRFGLPMTPVSPQHSSAHSILQSGKNWPKLARFLDYCSVGLSDNYSNEFEGVPASESELSFYLVGALEVTKQATHTDNSDNEEF